jgi:NADPH2:quinone reductase
MPHAIRIHQPGGPEALRWDEIEVGAPGPGQVLVRQTAIGLNYIDVYHRTGLYPLPSLPAVLGMEAAGRIEAAGAGVSGLAPGDRVAYASAPVGAYAQARLMPAERLIKVPDEISDPQAAAMMLKGMTVQYLIRRTCRVARGDTVLFHAAAGGVGLIACQWLKHLGATVIGTVGSDEKAEIARAHGCDYPINYRRESFAPRVREITGGKGVRVVYDSVGKDTFEGSLDCLEPFGLMVSFGNASGPVASFSPGVLAEKGSLFLTRPSLGTYTARREDLLATAEELFAVVRLGAVRIEASRTYPLREAAQAHRDLEARRTSGPAVLIP